MAIVVQRKEQGTEIYIGAKFLSINKIKLVLIWSLLDVLYFLRQSFKNKPLKYLVKLRNIVKETKELKWILENIFLTKKKAVTEYQKNNNKSHVRERKQIAKYHT